MAQSMTLRLADEVKLQLKRISKQDGLSVSDVARKAIESYVWAREFRRLRGKMLPYAERKGIYTDEDVFRIIS